MAWRSSSWVGAWEMAVLRCAMGLRGGRFTGRAMPPQDPCPSNSPSCLTGLGERSGGEGQPPMEALSWAQAMAKDRDAQGVSHGGANGTYREPGWVAVLPCPQTAGMRSGTGTVASYGTGRGFTPSSEAAPLWALDALGGLCMGRACQGFRSLPGLEGMERMESYPRDKAREASRGPQGSEAAPPCYELHPLARFAA